MNAVGYVDELVKEYLLWRGFTTTMLQFDVDRQRDRTKSFRVAKVVEQLFAFVDTCDLDSLLEFWRYLEENFMSSIREIEVIATIQTLSLSLKRYYVVKCVMNNRLKSLNEFFTVCAAELKGDKDWQAWFALPFIDNPASSPEFQIYFTKEWIDAFRISMHNFLCSVFHSLPLPRLLAYNRERLLRRKLEGQVEHMSSDVQRLSSELMTQTRRVVVLQGRLEAALAAAASSSSSSLSSTASTSTTSNAVSASHSSLLASDQFDDFELGDMKEMKDMSSSSSTVGNSSTTAATTSTTSATSDSSRAVGATAAGSARSNNESTVKFGQHRGGGSHILTTNASSTNASTTTNASAPSATATTNTNANNSSTTQQSNSSTGVVFSITTSSITTTTTTTNNQ